MSRNAFGSASTAPSATRSQLTRWCCGVLVYGYSRAFVAVTPQLDPTFWGFVTYPPIFRIGRGSWRNREDPCIAGVERSSQPVVRKGKGKSPDGPLDGVRLRRPDSDPRSPATRLSIRMRTAL